MRKMKRLLINLFDQFLLVYSIFLSGLFITDYAFIFNDGVSNFTTHSMIFVLLLGARYFLERGTFSDSLLAKSFKNITRLGDLKLLCFSALFFTLLFTYIGIMRHFAFSSSGIDMGVTDQAVWNTLKGRALFSSLDGNISHLGAHFEPVLFLITPFYFVWPNIIVLIFLQSLAIALAVWPLYLIAKQNLNSRLLVFVFVFAFFLSRPLRGVGLLDFHTDVFLIPLVILLMEVRRWKVKNAKLAVPR